MQNIRTERLSISPTSNMETEVTYAVAFEKKKKKGKVIVEASKITLQHFQNISCVVKEDLGKYIRYFCLPLLCFVSLPTVLINDLVK